MKTDIRKFKDYFNQYTELRMQENRQVSILCANGSITNNTRTANSGVSARCGIDGKWGFSASSRVSDESVREVLKQAERNASILGLRDKGMGIDSLTTNIGMSKSFFTSKENLTQRDLIDFVREIDSYIVKTYPKVTGRRIFLNCLDMEKTILTSDNSYAYTMIPRTFLYFSLTVDSAEGPVSLAELDGGLGEVEDVLKGIDHYFKIIDKTYNHLMNKCNAVYAKGGRKDVVLDSSLAGILAHEAIGHTTEADLVMSGSVAGENLDKKVASELVTLVDWANTYNGETLPVPVYVDDEGVKAEDVVIINEGILKSFMHNKQTAKLFGVEPRGNARAFEYSDEPLIRMRNTGFLPGKSKLEDMIASVEDGYYMMRSSNGQADTTSEFMFGVPLAYEIKNGKLGSAIKETTISGIAFDVLQSVTMVSDKVVWGSAGMCGKKQSIPVGMGGPAIKCRVNIGGI